MTALNREEYKALRESSVMDNCTMTMPAAFVECALASYTFSDGSVVMVIDSGAVKKLRGVIDELEGAVTLLTQKAKERRNRERD